MQQEFQIFHTFTKDMQKYLQQEPYSNEKIVGLHDAISELKRNLIYEKNKFIILYGPEQSGKKMLLKHMEEILDGKTFIWLQVDSFETEPYYLENLINIVKHYKKDVIIYCNEYEALQATFPNINLQFIELLDLSDVNVKIVIKVRSPPIIKDERLSRYMNSIRVRYLNPYEKLELVRHVIPAEQNDHYSDDELRVFIPFMSGYNAREIKYLVEYICHIYPYTSMNQWRRCATNIQCIPYRFRELRHSVPMYWCKIPGYAEVKRELEMQIALPYWTGKSFKRSLLLHAPPECPIPMFANALATECGCGMVAVNASNMNQDDVRQMEKDLRQLLVDAEALAPAILYIANIDRLFPNQADAKDSMLRELLMFLDEIKCKTDTMVMFVATTNSLESLEPALLEPGRIDLHVDIGLPNFETILAILKRAFNPESYSEDLVDKELFDYLPELARQFEGKSTNFITDFVIKCSKHDISRGGDGNRITLADALSQLYIG